MNRPGPRRGAGFVRAGEADLSRTGMSRKRAMELRLHRAWRTVAGKELAGRLRPVRIVRGTLELEYLDPKWSVALKEVLPGLLFRLIREDRSLGIRKFRVLGEGGEAVPIHPPASRGSR